MDKHRSENQTIQKLCLNRKQQNFQQLRQWDMLRARRLMIHRKLIDELDESIQLKMTESNAYIDVVRQFLTDLLTQKIKYQLHVVNNPESKIKNNLAGKTIHKNSGHELGRLYQLTNNYKGYKKLKSILQRGLEKVQNLLVESQKQIMQMKTKIEMTINQIQNHNESASEMCSTIVSIYNKEKNLKPIQCERDIYVQEQKFVYQAYLQTETQRELGNEVVKYLEYAQQLQKQKLVLIKEVIGSYLEGVKEDHEDEAQLNLLQDILKKQTENKYIEECYSSDELFSKSIKQQLAGIHLLHPKEITLKFVKHFLKKLQFNYFTYMNFLVLKQYHIFLKVDEELLEINLVVTVDGFLVLHFCSKAIECSGDSQQVLFASHDYLAKIDSSLVMQRDGDIALEVESKKSQQSFVMDKDKNAISLVFVSEDQREQFLEFVDNFIR